MRPPQRRQRARSAIQETTGRLSYQAMGAPQRGQRERGRTMDSPRGRRAMTTFAKLPSAAPRTGTQATTSGAGGVVAGATLARALERLGARDRLEAAEEEVLERLA